MKTSTNTHTLPQRPSINLTIQAKRIGIALFALSITALESWLRFPIQPVIDSYWQTSLSRIASIADFSFCARSF